MNLEVVLTQIELTDLAADYLLTINGFTLPSNYTAVNLVADMPQTYCIMKNSFGVDRLCCLRIGGTPLVISATNNTIPYTPVVSDFNIWFPGNMTSHPVHRPK